MGSGNGDDVICGMVGTMQNLLGKLQTVRVDLVAAIAASARQDFLRLQQLSRSDGLLSRGFEDHVFARGTRGDFEQVVVRAGEQVTTKSDTREQRAGRRR